MRFDNNSLLLYAVTDRSWLNGQTLTEQVEDCLKGGVTIVQLREKALDNDEFLKESIQIRSVCRKYGVPFIINDNVDIALASNADGIHVGQRDSAAGDTRKIVGPGKILGVSVQTIEQAIIAEGDGADYLGVGAVFPTATKSDADFVSLDTLSAICHAVKIPVVAIGGINRHNILELKDTGICGVAVISALFGEKDIKSATARLRTLAKETVVT